MGNWQTFSRLTGRERGIVLEAAAGLTATWVGLRLLGFRRWRSLLQLTVPRNTEILSENDSHSTAAGVLRMEEAAARNLFVTTNCLEQSLVLWWLLRRRGIAADLQIGARKSEQRFEAHAWVEFCGIALNSGGEDHLHFAPFEESATWIGTN
jgi:Transglutaminase-like superfamily